MLYRVLGQVVELDCCCDPRTWCTAFTAIYNDEDVPLSEALQEMVFKLRLAGYGRQRTRVRYEYLEAVCACEPNGTGVLVCEQPFRRSTFVGNFNFKEG